MSIESRKDFPQSYEIREDTESSMRGHPTHCFPSVAAIKEHAPFAKPNESIAFVVEPADSESWHGRAFGSRHTEQGNGLTGFYSCPNAKHACIVFNGVVTIIDTHSPTTRFDIPTALVPVTRIDALVEKRLLVFTGGSFVWAFGPEGVAWEMFHLEDACEFEITEITDTHIHLSAHAHAGGTIKRLINIATGIEEAPRESIDWLTREAAAKLIERYVSDVSKYHEDWCDFLERPYNDGKICEVVQKCWQLRQKYPPGEEVGFCNDEGMRLIATLPATLRE